MPKVKCSKTQTYIETFGRDYYTQTGESIVLHACNMAGNLQPKGLFELAFRSFISYMVGEARKLLQLEPSPEAVAVTSRVCEELKRFFHGTRLPTSMTNQLTKHLLIKLDSMHYMFKSSIDTDCGQQMLLSMVEVFMHPDVTAIELGPCYYHGFDFTYCNIITWFILEKVYNLPNLKVFNLPETNHRFYGYELKPVFPCQLKELTVHGCPHWCGDILRSIVESCPELKSLTICDCGILYQDITLVLQCKHLETLRLSVAFMEKDTALTLVKGLSTDNASDVLSASTLKSLSLRIDDQNTLCLIVGKLPHLTEIGLVYKGNIDLSSLTQLKNLRSLRLEASECETRNEYKKILPVLGKNLVLLDIEGDCTLDLEFIAETCTQLKCLHFSFISKCTEVNSSSKTFQNFKTVKCLTVRFPYTENDMAAFLISKCTSIKTLTVGMTYRWGALRNPLYGPIEDVLTRTPDLDWVVMEGVKHNKFLKSLFSRHPNFHVVKTKFWTRLSSQAVFDSFGCYGNEI